MTPETEKRGEKKNRRVRIPLFLDDIRRSIDLVVEMQVEAGKHHGWKMRWFLEIEKQEPKPGKR